MPVNLAPPGSKPEDRLASLERELRKVSAVADGALQIPPQARGGVAGQLLAGGLSMLDPQGLVKTLSLVAQLNGVSGTNGTNAFATIGSTTTLTVPTGRSQNFLAFMTLVASAAGGPGLNTTYFRLNINGQLSTTAQVVQQGTAAATLTLTVFLAALSLGGGSYTVAVEARTDGSVGTVAGVADGTVNVFLYGG